jgi:hypothetical protein
MPRARAAAATRIVARTERYQRQNKLLAAILVLERPDYYGLGLVLWARLVLGLDSQRSGADWRVAA